MIALWIATLVMSGYLAYVVGCFGIPRSLSDTFYLLGKRGWLFQCVLGVFGGLLMPVWLEVSFENAEFLAFLACAGLLFVAAAPCFKVELEGKVHYTAAVVCCVAAFIWQLVEMCWVLPVCSLGLALGATMVTKGKLFWWVEMGVMVSSLVSVWLRMIV